MAIKKYTGDNTLQEVVAKTKQLVAGKQDQLTAGTNITIDANNVISATGGGSITVDDALSSTSTNPVQNKVINSALGNKVDKTSNANKVYGTDSSGNQTTIDYSSSQTNSANKIVQRDSNGDIQTNAIRSNNVKSYAKNFYNNNGSPRYCHIGTLKVGGPNNFFAGKIYTASGYADNDTIQEIVDFNVEINNNNNLKGFATCEYNYYTTQDEIILYFVPTSNSLEWEVYLRMHSWSNALVEISMSAPSATDYKFTFDASDANFVNHPDNAVLIIEPRKSTNYTTNEVVIGTWIDGSPLYRKVFNYTESNNSTWTNIINCSSLNIRAVIKIYGSAGDSYNWVNLPAGEGQYYRNFRYDVSSKYIQSINNGFNGSSGYIAIEYIKN